MSPTKTAFISTAIPYVNAIPHVGFAMELIQADVMARYMRLIGFDTFFMAGTDENSLKSVRMAHKLGITTQKLCEQNSEAFYKLISGLCISINRFVRTSSSSHRETVNKFWMSSISEDIFKKYYEGYYCVDCEDYYQHSLNPVCPEHGTLLEKIVEENYFFRLSHYQRQVLKIIEDNVLQIIPVSRKNEILSFIKMGLHDFSISRTKERSHNSGIQVPTDPEQIIYVWYDALISYISTLGYNGGEESSYSKDDFYKYWLNADRRIHIIGKGINRFHTVYWPAMLMSANIPLPHLIFVHGYLTINNQKISKSIGNVIDPLSQADRYGTDALRYYLLRAVSPTEDSDYNEKQLIEVYNSDLANNLGNLILRIESIGERAQYIVPFEDSHVEDGHDITYMFHVEMENFRFNNALAILWSICDEVNEFFETETPWILIKEKNKEKINEFLDIVIHRLQTFTFWLEAFLPLTAQKIRNRLSPGLKLTKTDPLFPRIV